MMRMRSPPPHILRTRCVRSRARAGDRHYHIPSQIGNAVLYYKMWRLDRREPATLRADSEKMEESGMGERGAGNGQEPAWHPPGESGRAGAAPPGGGCDLFIIQTGPGPIHLYYKR